MSPGSDTRTEAMGRGTLPLTHAGFFLQLNSGEESMCVQHRALLTLTHPGREGVSCRKTERQKGSAVRRHATVVNQNPGRQTDGRGVTQGCRQSHSVGSRTSTLEGSDLHKAPRDREPGDKLARSSGGESHA